MLKENKFIVGDFVKCKNSKIIWEITDISECRVSATSMWDWNATDQYCYLKSTKSNKKRQAWGDSLQLYIFDRSQNAE